ncbi:hypothetical protein L1987_29435 [Smallanthus sonchifolius]|uniref:Uncharacterized protein n=1 Tax=Smallanthus sonchifolius TaxID=185202 RepID=A0ACB9I188_9ASTR|nr:hypothetical protein L1987_29435 [Smallanthus sonchifolius]
MGSREQQTSTRLQEKAVALRGNRIKKSLDYNKLDNPLYVGQRHERMGHLQPVVNHNEPIKDDGPVKHMKNLPGYLQRVEKVYNIQGKALNFGVLDWGRLENWKSNEKRIPPRVNMKTSLSTNNPTLVESRLGRFSRNKKKIQQTPNGSPFNSSSKERLPPGVRWPRGKPVKPQFSENSPSSIDLPHGDKYLMVELIDGSKGKQVDQMTLEKETSSSGDDINHVDDHLIEANEIRLSNCFSPGEFDSPNPFSDVPHSCPFPLPLSADVESPNQTPVTPVKKSDVDINEPATEGKRPSSSNRRFSFSLGKMARSFSFKESSNTTSAVPQLSPAYISVRSGPVNFQASSPDSVNHNRSKSAATNPSRSSPLRRILDPLLKLKGVHLDEKVHKSKLDRNPNTVTPVNKNASLHSKKHRLCNVQALLQLTLKNGIPFFKLVVESGSDILAAAVKKLPSGKDDTSLIYAFYSVHETKKKIGSWIYQSSKEKGYGFGYNIVGQMKISSSYHAEFSGPEKDLYVVRESVLYSSDTTRTDEKTLDSILDGELAAIIVKNPSDEICGDIGSCKSTAVVLPDGVHSWPNSGSPSPLIDRWRSGGACDCGGWDIGCQFHILSHQHETIKTTNCLDLSFQVGNKNRFSFRLVSLEEGLYSLEYDPSMSMLQAFSICVAVVSSQKLTHIFQVNYVPESKSENIQPPTSDTKVKSREEFVSKPPASPVGRV